MSVSVSNANAVLKVRYARDLTKILMLDPMMEPFMALTARKKGQVVKRAVGQVFHVPIKTRDPQAAGYSFTKAQGKSDGSNGQSNYTGFDVSVVPGYATGRVDGQAIPISQGDDNAFIDLLDEETQGALRMAQQELAMASFKAGTGSRGRIGSTSASDPSVTLATTSDAVFFEIDMNLVGAAADGTGSLRSATAIRITGINPVTGKLTLSSDPTALGWVAGDYLFVDGDFVASTSTKVMGLGGWNPITPPSASESFYGIDRSSNWKLFGLRYDATSASSTSQAIINATALVRQFAKGKTTHGFMNPIDWGNLVGGYETNRRTTVDNHEYNLSFSALKFYGQTGEFPLLPDANVPKGRCHLINMEHVYWIHAGDELAYVAQEDGNMVLRKGDADAYEVRVRSQANLVVDDPSQMCVVYNIT